MKQNFILILTILICNYIYPQRKYFTEYIHSSFYLMSGDPNEQKIGFLDRDGKIIISDIYSDALNETEGLTNIVKDGVYGYLTKDNQEKLFPQFYKAFWNGKIGIGVNKDKKKALIDMNGNLITDFKFEKVQVTNDKFIFVEENKQNNFIDYKGKYIFKDLFTLTSFGIYNSQAIFEKNNNGITKYGLVNINGKIIADAIYDKIYGSNDSKNWVVFLNNKWGIIDSSGKIIIPVMYDKINHVVPENDLIPVMLNGKYGYINNNNKLVISYNYDMALPFRGGYAKVAKDGKYGFIDEENNATTSFEYAKGWDGEDYFNNGLAKVERNGKVGFIDKKGKVIIPVIYDSAENFKDGLSNVKLNGKYGLINATGKVIVPFEYDYLSGLNNNRILFVK